MLAGMPNAKKIRGTWPPQCSVKGYSESIGLRRCLDKALLLPPFVKFPLKLSGFSTVGILGREVISASSCICSMDSSERNATPWDKSADLTSSIVSAWWLRRGMGACGSMYLKHGAPTLVSRGCRVLGVLPVSRSGQHQS